MLGKKKLVISLPNQARCPGKKITKTKQAQSKIYKNLSEFPIDLYPGGKENHMQNNRPQSSLLRPTHYARVQSALSNYPQREINRKRLSLDSTNKRAERDSLMSKHSFSKRPSKNNVVVEEITKKKIAEDRKRNNLSCCSYVQQKSRGVQVKKKKGKRNSVSQLHGVKKDKPSTIKLKQERIAKQQKIGKEKSRSKSRKAKKSIVLNNSKASTSLLGFNQDKTLTIKQRFLPSKKQSTSTAVFNPVRKQKKKYKKQKIQKPQDYSLEEYPINKYQSSPAEIQKAEVTLQRIYLKPNRKINSKTKSRKSKSRSKSRKSKSRSKSRKVSLGRSGQGSLLDHDYMSCINIPSSNSGLIPSQPISNQSTSQIKIVDNYQFNQLNQSNPPSLNFQEIRYYESQPSHQKRQKAFMQKNFKKKQHYNKRKQIQIQISEDYPNFTQLQLKFLASVVFIQRKWRQNRLYKQIFIHYTSIIPSQQIPFIERSSSKQLNISTQKKQISQRVKKATSFQQQIEQYEAQYNSYQQPFLSKNAYLQQNLIYNDGQNDDQSDMQGGQVSKRDPIRSARYQYLQMDLFPNVSYLMIKKQQLRDQLQQHLAYINFLHTNNNILYTQYLKLKQSYQQKYAEEINVISKSKKDIKKGYLKYIDSVRSIRHQGLRRVSSENGFMAQMYSKIFKFQQNNDPRSQSSQSVKKLAQKLLIRKDIQASQLSLRLNNSFSDRGINTDRSHQAQDLSARFFRSKRQEGNSFRQNMLIEIKTINQTTFVQKTKKQEQNVQPLPAARTQKVQIQASPRIMPLSLQTHKRSIPSQDKQRKYLRQQKVILQQLISSLTQQLFVQLVRIDELRESLLDVVHAQKSLVFDIQASKIIDFDQSPERLDVSHNMGEEQLQKIYKIQGLTQGRPTDSSRHHRGSKTFHISPISSENNPLQISQIVFYAAQLVKYISESNSLREIVKKLNKNQGFMALQYLKFLRDFQIPDQDYEPIITNEIFISWQESFMQKNHSQKSSTLQKQATTIYHRAVFQCLISFLQQRRPCGQKGLPFPWQKIQFFYRIVLQQQMSELFQKWIGRLKQWLNFGCGIIEEHSLICSQQDWQNMQQQNEDKIIVMLQGQLKTSPDNWYQIEQHCLQIKMEIQGQVLQYILLQALDDVLELL